MNTVIAQPQRNTPLALPTLREGIIVWALLGGIVSMLFAMNVSLAQELSKPSREFVQAVAPREWQFPRDHGKHAEFQTEWWYYTGNLRSAKGRRFGYQLTFFRNALSIEPPTRQSRWAFRDGYVAHFTITDVDQQKFFYDQSMSRGALGLAESANDSLAVRVGAWSIEGGNAAMRLQAESEFGHIDFKLENTHAPALHGRNGFVQKGEQSSEASYYYSLPNLKTQGSLRLGEDSLLVEGTSWMDHEFFTSPRQSQIAGWDWFSLRLSDSTAIMLYVLREADGTLSSFSGGTVISKNENVTPISFGSFEASPQSWWRSDATGGEYPIAWQLKVAEYELRITTPVENQELGTRTTTGVIYWEGYIEVSGTKRGQSLNGLGYLEMTGYTLGLDLSQKN